MLATGNEGNVVADKGVLKPNELLPMHSHLLFPPPGHPLSRCLLHRLMLCAFQVLATGGDATLGGDDWDEAIMTHIDTTYLRPYGIDASAPDIRSRLRTLSRNAKECLSTAHKVAVRLPIGGPDGEGVSFTMTRQLLDDLCADLFRRCRLPIEQACWQAGVDLGSVLEGHSESMQRYYAHGQGQQPPTVKIVPKRRQPISEVRLWTRGASLPVAGSRWLTALPVVLVLDTQACF